MRTKHPFVLIYIRNKVRLVPSKVFKPSSIFFYRLFQGDAFVDPFCCLCFVNVCHAVLSVPYSLLVNCWERADLLALLYIMFSCVCVTSHMVSWSGVVFDCIDSGSLLPSLFS